MTWPGSDLTSREIATARAVRKRHVADNALLTVHGVGRIRAVLIVEDAITITGKAAFDPELGQNPVIGAGDDDMAAGSLRPRPESGPAAGSAAQWRRRSPAG